MKCTKIAIDCGHNCAPDIGAWGNGVQEDTITKAVGELVIAKLTKRGLPCVNTLPARSNGTVSGSLAQRVNTANNAGVGLYVSIHCNSAVNSAAKGAEVYYYAGNETGKQLASILSKELADELDTLNRGAKEANFYVLRATQMDAILIEVGFLSNAVEARKIKDSVEVISDRIAEVLFEWNFGQEWSVPSEVIVPNHLAPKHLSQEHEEPNQTIIYAKEDTK
jgi:N-acetylmuramoyl-L-alanine amidase